MSWLKYAYNIIGTGLAVVTLPVWLTLVLLRRKHRVSFLRRAGWIPPAIRARLGTKPTLWFHAVSVGEFSIAATLIEALRPHYPDHQFVVTVTTLTGHEVASKRLREEDVLLFFPIEFWPVMHGVVRKVNPRVAIITETELWPNFIFALEREKVPCLLVNGRISDRSFPRYRLVRVCMHEVLTRIAGMYMQTERDAHRIEAIGAPPERVQVCGNVKLDSAEVTDPPVKDEALQSEASMPEGTQLFLAAALDRTGAEDPVALDVLERLRGEFPDAALMIVPRHPERGPAIEALVAERGYVPRRRSRGDSFDDPARQVFILDTVGELKRFYTLARVVFVGKSLFAPGGGQNMIEPVGLGLPVLYGGYTANFRAIADELVHAGGARRVTSPEELAEAALELWRDPDSARAMARRGQACIRSQQGATERIVKAILAAAPPAAGQ